MKEFKKIISSHSVRMLVLLFSMVLILAAAVGTSLAFIVAKTPSIYNIFVSGLDPNGDLVIRKTVEHPFGVGYVIPDDVEFAFEVDLGAENGGKTFDGQTADENGVISVTVKANSAVAIHDIAEGTKVTVTEKPAGHGFSVKDGGAVRETTIKKGEINTIEFVNAYVPDQVRSVNLTVSGVKELEGREWQEGDNFTFELAVFERGKWTRLGTDTVTCRLTEDGEFEPDFNKFDFSELIKNISFDQEGTYSFRVSEIEGSIGGIVYDKAESYFDVLVGDADMDGYLEIQRVTAMSENTQIEQDEETGRYAAVITFKNSYAPAGSAEAFIQINKILDDTSGQDQPPAGFVFGLYDENGVLYKTSEATSAIGDTVIRLVFEPTDAGKTFIYTLKEMNGGQTIDGITYDDTEIKIQVSVVDNLDGTISAFVYDYQEPAVVKEEQDIDVNTESNDLPNTLEDTLPDTDESISDESISDETISDETISDGSISDETIPDETISDGSISDESIFDETISDESISDESTSDELISGETDEAVSDKNAVSGKNRDGAVDAFTEDESGKDAEITIPSDASDIYKAEFRNVYDPKDAEMTISGDKDLTGREMKAGEFSFNLYQTGSDFAISDENSPVDTAWNMSENGHFTFDDLKFSKVGTYYYVVTEDSSEQLGGVTYDDSKYFVVIQVTDLGGELSADSRITCETGEESDIKFHNTYTPAKAIVALEGEKVLNGKHLTEGEFSFELYEADEAFEADGTAIQLVGNNADGEIHFADLSFTEEGTWYYVIKENTVKPVDGVIYDDAEYHVTVTVTDDGSGKLSAASAIEKDGEQVNKIIFKNAYTPLEDAVVNIDVKKTVDNVGSGKIGPEGFEFVLLNTETGEKAIVQSDKDGLAAFTLVFTKADADKTYHYCLTEAAGAQEGVTYSDTVYDFEITVTLDEDSKILAVLTRDGKKIEHLTAEFVNIYSSENIVTPDTNNPSGISGGDTGTQSKPKTGDDSNIRLYAGLLMLSAVILILLFVIGKRRKK